MDKFISIKEASTLLGVTTTTLRRWEQNGSFCPDHRTFGNHRRYELESILKLTNKNKENEEVVKKTICYARVSSHDQKEDLTRQTKVLEIYSKEHDLQNVEYINDIGSVLILKRKV